MKKILKIKDAPAPHWVGDGFPVRSMFSYHNPDRFLSPFLLLDHAGPAHFDPAVRPRGVGQHPHRGFETVTIVYQGEVEHKDSTGAGGKIGPADVQWMTAASGIIHEEFHSHEFTRTGGTLEMVQLWVNLPARDKMTAPRYQTLLASDIPVIELDNAAGSLRVIAGEFAGRHGPALTFTPMDVWDLRLNANVPTTLGVPEGRSLALVVLKGSIRVNAERVVAESQMAVLGIEGHSVALEAGTDASVLLLSGEPINEPIAGYGPFVMNTQAEIQQAILDFNSGRFGQIPR